MTMKRSAVLRARTGTLTHTTASINKLTGAQKLGRKLRILSTARQSLHTEPTASATQESGKYSGHSHKHAEDRDFFLDILSSTATKREAKSYLSKFKPTSNYATEKSSIGETSQAGKAPKVEYGANLGPLYTGSAKTCRGQDVAQGFRTKSIAVDGRKIHVALILLRACQDIEDKVLEGLGRTISQISKLGLHNVVVVDVSATTDEELGKPEDPLLRRSRAIHQANRVVAAIEHNGEQAARLVDNCFEIVDQDLRTQDDVHHGKTTTIADERRLVSPLKRGVVPVLPTIGYMATTQRAEAIDAEEVVLAISKHFSPVSDGLEWVTSASKLRDHRTTISCDRLIILDSQGGIPNTKLASSHVFINLEQEYKDIIAELDHTTNQAKPVSNARHSRNLKLAKDVLAHLPSTASAVLTTPLEAIQSKRDRTAVNFSPGVGTRRQKNPLIHNLLTDKPIISSSLPRSKSTVDLAHPVTALHSPTTLIRRGMPLTIIPDPRIRSWTPPALDGPTLKLTDPRIDLSRLTELINDSFGRTLDTKQYLERTDQNLAGIIVAGSYEGGAILTWEAPPNLPKDFKPGTAEYNARLVPYLDKFAVLKRSQGAGGVADVVFSSMVRDCFPDGVCWRSRRTNPVNKWYFERARGTWKIPVEPGAQGWTMFWTTEGVTGERFKDYEGVCRSVETSWADAKAILD